ncbi:hypothetical protein Leryth_017117 [Lithospermum erythrorhizon]|nr:hypothetical protein Leryth_017117 [Lithospermum erythrorhizon]
MARALTTGGATTLSSSLSPLRHLKHLSSTPTTTSTTVASLTHHHSLEVVGGGEDIFIPALAKNLQKPYNSYPVIGWNRHLETIFAAFFRSRPDVGFNREILRTKDNGSNLLGQSGTGCLQMLPCSFWVAWFDWWSHITRAHMLLVPSKKQVMGGGMSVDITEVVGHVRNLYPNADLYAVGWSLGANILVRYLGQEGESCRLSGAVSLCNPFDLVIADEDFHKGFNNVYDKALANSLRRIFMKHAHLFQNMGGEYNISLVANAKTVREFDEGLTRVSFGFKSVDEYYSKSCSSDSVKLVRTPLLCIQARYYLTPYPVQAFQFISYARKCLESWGQIIRLLHPGNGYVEENRNCLLIVTPKGGHLGWVAGSEAPFGAPWTDPVVMDFLEYLQQVKSQDVETCSAMPASKSLKFKPEENNPYLTIDGQEEEAAMEMLKLEDEFVDRL